MGFIFYANPNRVNILNSKPIDCINPLAIELTTLANLAREDNEESIVEYKGFMQHEMQYKKRALNNQDS